MTLSEYIAPRSATKILAIDTGMCHSHISSLASGRKQATLEAAIKIEIATKGVIMAETLLRPSLLPLLAHARGQG